jgi:hypothetical protein
MMGKRMTTSFIWILRSQRYERGMRWKLRREMIKRT